MDIYRKVPSKEKRPHGRQPTFTNEFMMMVCRKVVEEGMTYRTASKTFGISTGAVGSWVKKYKKGDWKETTTPTQSNEHRVYLLEESIKDLKKEIGELYLENLMLKKALYHSNQIKKQSSSVITSENLDQFQEDVE